jgi:hypothetical protein
VTLWVIGQAVYFGIQSYCTSLSKFQVSNSGIWEKGPIRWQAFYNRDAIHGTNTVWVEAKKHQH